MGYVVVALPLLLGHAGVLDSDFVATATYDLGIIRSFYHLTLYNRFRNACVGFYAANVGCIGSLGARRLLHSRGPGAAIPLPKREL